jgi:hypothetical protein
MTKRKERYRKNETRDKEQRKLHLRFFMKWNVFNSLTHSNTVPLTLLTVKLLRDEFLVCKDLEQVDILLSLYKFASKAQDY